MGRRRHGGDRGDTGASRARADPPPQQESPHAQSALPWGMEKAEMQPSSLTGLTDDKLARFVLGHQKKTKFQKEREDRAAKKRQADAEAAEIYATFVASFDNEDESLGKAFVRGEATKGTQAAAPSASSQHTGELYRLKPKDATVSSAFSGAAVCAGMSGSTSGKKVSEMDRMLQEIKQSDADRTQRREQFHSQQPKKKRAIDEFLEEMKERGPAPVTLDGVGGMARGSFDTGDPETTNLYVGNLAPTVTEEVLEAEFKRYGEVYSIKIMWPRSEEERARKRNCGFVSFYERRDADDARVSLDNKELEGQPMIVGWGKAVKIEPRARAPGLLLPSAALPPPVATVAGAPGDVDLTGKPSINVEAPADSAVRRRIDRLAQYVAADGLQFENAVRLRESSNKANYGFLFETQSPLALYYRWRVYSFAMGDDEHSWRDKPFQMTVDGPVWVPPKMPPRSRDNRDRGSSSRSTGRHSYRRGGSSSDRSAHKRSHSYSRSRSRSSSSTPRRSRRRSRSASRHRSRSRSYSGDRDGRSSRRRRSRSRSYSRSRSRGHRSRSWSSDDSRSSPRKSRRRSRSHGRSGRRRTQETHQETARTSVRGHDRVEKDEKLLTGQQIARARDLERGREPNRLSPDDYEEFRELLKGLTLERESVKRTMGFALDNSEAATDLVNVILETFRDAKVSAVSLVGVFYVTSDILHNSSAAVKNASLFRTTFQDCLPEIMDSLRLVHKRIGGRMSANAMKEKVLNVLSAWESWSLFPPGVLVGLNATFLRKVEEDEYMATYGHAMEEVGEADVERLRKTCRQAGILSTGDAKQLLARLQWLKEFTSPTATAIAQTSGAKNARPHAPGAMEKPEVSTQPTAGAKLVGHTKEKKGLEQEESWDGEAIDGKDLDGEPIDGEPIDGEPADGDDIDGVPMDDDMLDGEPLDNEAAGHEEELDGEPLDEDLDGAPMDDEDEDLDGEPI